MSSRSSIFRSVFGASSSAAGGSAYSPFRRSAGAFAIGSGSASGSGGVGRLTLGGLAGANDFRAAVRGSWRRGDGGVGVPLSAPF